MKSHFVVQQGYAAGFSVFSALVAVFFVLYAVKFLFFSSR
jgi:hypothetical protein